MLSDEIIDKNSKVKRFCTELVQCKDCVLTIVALTFGQVFKKSNYEMRRRAWDFE